MGDGYIEKSRPSLSGQFTACNTLVVVPVLYFLIERSKDMFAAGRDEFERKRIEAYMVLAGEKGEIEGR